MGGEDVDVEERSIAELAADMARGAVTSEALVLAYQARIEALDRAGPALASVISVSPRAVAEARARDAERRAGAVRGPLHGVPILVKDNIEVADGTATTAGSLALAQNRAVRDAALVRRLKDAGAVILGKTNLSEWANIRSPRSVSGWSAVGGLTRNPYALDRSAGGSSSGTGSAIAASLAAAGVGTETDGSITSPASKAALVGLKPTLGLISRSRVVPIAHSQDTAGPMARSVADAALLLAAMAGSDPDDAATLAADANRRDYLGALAAASFQGARLGVLDFAASLTPDLTRAFEAAVALMRAEGAEVIETGAAEPGSGLRELEGRVLLAELKADLTAYLMSTPPQVECRTLADVIAFNRATPRETCLFGQELFEQADALPGLDDPAYLEARAASLRAAGPDGIERLLREHRLDALIAPSFGPAGRIDVAAGDRGVGRSAQLPAIAGLPHLTLPMGEVRGLPIGLSFIGAAWSEAKLLALGFAFERAAGARRPPRYLASVEDQPELLAAFAPTAR